MTPRETSHGGSRLRSSLRWVARLWSAASLGVIVAFLLGEADYPATSLEWFGFLFFPLGLCLGLLIAWRRERLGGLVAVVSFLAFYGVHFATAGRLPGGLAWPILAAPGFLFLGLSLARPAPRGSGRRT